MCCSGHRPGSDPLACGQSGSYNPASLRKTRIIPGEIVMPRRSLVIGVGFLVLFAWLASTGKLLAQANSQALAGKVMAEQGALEGVLVSARRAGSTVTVTVVTDKDG